jgi:hypothetical protein
VTAHQHGKRPEVFEQWSSWCHRCRGWREILIVEGAAFGLVAAGHVTVHRGHILGWVMAIHESSIDCVSTDT